MRRLRSALYVALIALVAVSFVGAASPQGLLYSPIQQTIGATSTTFAITVPNNAGCALFLEVLGYSPTGDFAYTFKNIGVKNTAGTVTTYSLPTNLLSVGTVDTGLALATVAMSTGTGTLVTTMTGVVGETVNWQVFWTQKCSQP